MPSASRSWQLQTRPSLCRKSPRFFISCGRRRPGSIQGRLPTRCSADVVKDGASAGCARDSRRDAGATLLESDSSSSSPCRKSPPGDASGNKSRPSRFLTGLSARFGMTNVLRVREPDENRQQDRFAWRLWRRCGEVNPTSRAKNAREMGHPRFFISSLLFCRRQEPLRGCVVGLQEVQQLG